jgi:hypothetical protein
MDAVQARRECNMQVKPSVLHGDLWSGNISGVDGEPSIFDPAVYYGHSEADFGMSWCAGFSSAFYDAYHRVLPKAPGQSLVLCSRNKVDVCGNHDGSLLRRHISLSAFVSFVSNVLLGCRDLPRLKCFCVVLNNAYLCIQCSSWKCFLYLAWHLLAMLTQISL